MELKINQGLASDNAVKFLNCVFWEAAKELGISECKAEVQLGFALPFFELPFGADGSTCAHCRNPFEILVDVTLNPCELGLTLCHEMIHLKQMLLDNLTTFEGDDGEFYSLYKGQTTLAKDINGPVEREAYEGQDILYNKVLARLDAKLKIKEEIHATA